MATYNEIIEKIEEAVAKFNKKIPAAQRSMYEEIQLELRRLDVSNGKVKTTVANLKVIQSIKNKLMRVIMTDEYVADVKEFVKTFSELSRLQNDYWKKQEKQFKPKTLLKEIRNQAIQDTVGKLTEAGIGNLITEQIADILRTNITSGGSYKNLENQLRESLTDTKKSDGILTKNLKQVTTDSINQYNAQYTQAVSNSLNYEWFGYQGSDIKTTRPFCDAMTDFRYFHVSEVPRLLRAEDLYYDKKGVKTKVPIYDKTGLPHGLIDGTNPENFFVRRGGYNCGHQIRPVSERLVPQDIKDRVFATEAYKRWKG